MDLTTLISLPTPVNPGLPPSQLNQSNFSTPGGKTPGSENGQNQSIFSNP